MDNYRIEHYLTAFRKQNVYATWLTKLRDTRTKIAVARRVIRMQLGNFGDHRFCREGVWEMRIDYGPGYRQYDYGHGYRQYWKNWQTRGSDEKQTR